jgi:pimeloyl-ACP methyl ester carboxylesterase
MTILTWVKRIVVAGLALALATLAAGIAYEQGSRWSAMRAYPPVGELVEINGKRTHLHCTGRGQPTVILESGASVGGSLDWTLVQPSIARLSRVCSYDRAGVLWSDRRRGPRDANRIAAELHALLGAVSEPPPYVMVGHSLGGALVRVFAGRFNEEVVGFVFIDSSHPDQEARLRAELPEYPYEIPWSSLGMIQTATGFYRLTAKPLGLGLGDELEEPMRRLQPKTVAALASELSVVDDIFEQAREAGALGDRPLVVLTAGNVRRPSMSQATGARYATVWLQLQTELAALSTNSLQRTVEHAHHYIQLANPEAVVAAVRDVLTAVRDSTPLVGREAHR